MTDKFFIYRHVRHDKNEPFYIGKGTAWQTQVGYKWYYRRAYDTKLRNRIWKSIVSRTGYDVEIIFTSNDESIINEKEKEFISMYGRINKGGCLCNLTDGGDGVLVHEENFYESVKRRKSEGVYNKIGKINSRPFYAYDLSGAYVKKFESKKYFHKKTGYDASEIYASIKEKRSFRGHFFSNEFYPNGLDISQYTLKKFQYLEILRVDQKGHLEVFDSIDKAAESINRTSRFGVLKSIKNNVWYDGYMFKTEPGFYIKNFKA